MQNIHLYLPRVNKLWGNYTSRAKKKGRICGPFGVDARYAISLPMPQTRVR